MSHFHANSTRIFFGPLSACRWVYAAELLHFMVQPAVGAGGAIAARGRRRFIAAREDVGAEGG